jgi:carbon-monoxide dehydrogenase medium subunit
MKPCAFAYYDPATVDDAVKLLGTLENARVLAGGQSLVPMMNFRFVQPDALIDINGIAELKGIAVRGDRVEVGAATRQRDLEYSRDVATLMPLMAETIPNIGHRQTRNRGTIGGSIAHADPAAELPMLAVAFDATLEAASLRGRRSIAAGEFARGYMMTALEPDEMLTRVTLPVWPNGHGFAFLEFARRRGDFAMAAAAVMLLLDGRGAITRASLTLAGVGPRPLRLKEAEAKLVGEVPSPALVNEAAAIAGRSEAVGDVHAPAEYRQHLARVLTGRALNLALARARGGHA